MFDLEQNETKLISDTICYTTQFWWVCEIGEKKVIYLSSLIDIDKYLFPLLINWKT